MINFSNVTLAFDDHILLDDISLTIKPGEFVFLVGQTGCGKSSLLRLIYLDLHPTKGHVSFAGYSSASISDRQKPFLRRSLGIVFQDFRLLDDRTVYDNVAFALHVTGAKSGEIKKKVMRALGDVGLSHQRHKKTQELSGGEQQRVGIARALVNNPQCILADEPTGNLDPATSGEILKLLKDINARGTAILMATHNYELVRKSNDRVIRILDGKLVEGIP